MKKCIVMVIVLVSGIIKAQDSTYTLPSPHHGIVKTIQGYKIESVESYGCISIYIYDEELRPIPNKGVSGEVLFFYNNDASLNVVLKPKLDNSFTAEVLNSSYYYYSVNLSIYKKIIKIKFNNISGLADTENKNTGNK